MPLRGATLFPFMLMLFALVLLGPSAWAQASAPDSQQPGANAVAASNPAPLPDAPLSVASSPSSAGNHVPLEQQPHPTVTVREAPFHMLQDGKHRSEERRVGKRG